MDVSCECCVLSGRGLCDELITRPEESYWLWCVVRRDLKTSRMWKPCPTGGLLRQNKQKLFVRSTLVLDTFSQPVSEQTGVSWPSLNFSSSRPATIARLHIDSSLFPIICVPLVWMHEFREISMDSNEAVFACWNALFRPQKRREYHAKLYSLLSASNSTFEICTFRLTTKTPWPTAKYVLRHTWGTEPSNCGEVFTGVLISP